MTVIMILCITVNAQKQSNRTLVAYFSATGTTEKAAKQIAEVTGGALYEIQPAKKYTSADLTGTTNPRAKQCGNGRCLVTSRIAFPAPQLGSL